MRILAISGSLRAASHNTALLRAATDVAPAGVEVVLYDGLDRLPHYNEDHDTDDPHGEVQRLRDAIASADLVLISTPEYNGSVPGHLKTAVDWASRPFGPGSSLWGKPVAVIGASTTVTEPCGRRIICASRWGWPAPAFSTQSWPSRTRPTGSTGRPVS